MIYGKRESGVGQSVPSSFSELLRQTALQTDLTGIKRTHPAVFAQAQELCAIIAEVYSMASESEINVNGERMRASFVADVFLHLTSEHILAVIENYNQRRYAVKNKKSYLRTALYNSVFELANGIVNDIASGR